MLKRKQIPFGPGHPDFDNQLPLFDDADEPVLNLREQNSPVGHPEGGHWPANAVVKAPCPHCRPIESLQPIFLESSGSNNTGQRERSVACPACNDKGCVQMKVARIDGVWMDKVKQIEIRAASLEQAYRKVKLSRPESGTGQPERIVPFYAEHGGYAAD